VTGESGFELHGDGRLEVDNLIVRGGQVSGGIFESADYVPGTSGLHLNLDTGFAEFFDINIYGTVPMPQVFAGAIELASGGSYPYLSSITLTIATVEGTTAYYRTDGLVPTGLPAELVPSNNQITLDVKSMLRVVAFEDSTSRSSPTFSAAIKVNNPIAVWGRTPDENELAYIRSYYQSNYIAWGTSGSRFVPPSSWAYRVDQEFTNLQAEVDGYQYGTLSVGSSWLWYCHTNGQNTAADRVGNFYVRQVLSLGGWGYGSIYIMGINGEGGGYQIASFSASGIDDVDDY